MPIEPLAFSMLLIRILYPSPLDPVVSVPLFKGACLDWCPPTYVSVNGP